MKRNIFFIILFLSGISMYASNCIYSWSSPNGIISEYGGTLVQHNQDYVRWINYGVEEYHTFVLVGNKENLHDEENTQSSCYMEITLSDGMTFAEGDVITLSGFRNIKPTKNATIWFEFSNGNSFEGTGTWSNMGIAQEYTFGGGFAAKGRSGSGEVDPLYEDEVFLGPSINEYIVPKEAAGCTSLRLTRCVADTYLYFNEISISRDETASVRMPVSNSENCYVYNISGIKTTNNTKGLYIKGNKKYFNK